MYTRIDVKAVYVDSYGHHPIYLREDDYTAILTDIEIQRVCKYCGECFDGDYRPMVAENTCLSCFHKKHQDYYGELTFLGEKYDYHIYAFLVERTGEIITSSTSSEDVSNDPYATLTHWGFHVPSSYQRPNGETATFYHYQWSYIGSPRDDGALYLYYYDHYWDGHEYKDVEIVYLAFKDGNTVPFNKRRKVFQQLEKEAEALSREGGYTSVRSRMVAIASQQFVAHGNSTPPRYLS